MEVGGEGDGLYTFRYTVTTRMTSALIMSFVSLRYIDSEQIVLVHFISHKLCKNST